MARHFAQRRAGEWTLIGTALGPGVAVARATPDLDTLEARIGHRFADRALLAEALTHTSAPRGEGSYERLEYLGDRVLALAVADGLFRADPEADEGDLSRRLAMLVRRENCTAVAQSWEVAPHLRLDKGAALSGARRNAGILADVCEAILGAIFLDAGYDAARAVVARDFAAPLALAVPGAGAGERGRDAKTVLQEWAQARRLAPPCYEVVEREGPDHAPRFRIAARLEGLEPGIGLGTSKRVAEQEAARDFLVREGLWAVAQGATDGTADA